MTGPVDYQEESIGRAVCPLCGGRVRARRWRESSAGGFVVRIVPTCDGCGMEVVKVPEHRQGKLDV